MRLRARFLGVKGLTRGLVACSLIIAFSSLKVFSQELELNSVIQKAINASYDLKIADVDVAISKKDVWAARAEYLPTVQSRMHTEYLKDLENGFRPVTSVGDTIIPAGTRYQNSIGMSATQTLLDFGIRHKKVGMAKQVVEARLATQDQTTRDLKLKVVDVYTDALLKHKAIQAYENILNLAQQGYQMKKRLNDAGVISRVDVATEAIEVAQALDELENLRQQMEQALQNLTYYTRENYDPATVELYDIVANSDEFIDPDIAGYAFPEERLYDAQIEQKQKEVELLRRQYFPQLGLYSNYNIYGFDPDHLSGAFDNLSQRTVSMGLSITMPVFDGFRNKIAIDKAKLEKQRLAWEKEKVLAELRHQAETYQQQLETQTVLLKTKAEIVEKSDDKLLMINRLTEQQLLDKTQSIQDQIGRIQKQLEQDNTHVQQSAAFTKLQILAAGS